MIKNNFKLIGFVFVFILCGTNDSAIEENLTSVVETTITTSTTTSTTTTILDTTTTVTTTTGCIPDNNSNINFQNLRNVQSFLNKYGFNAGDEDGYLGQQTVSAIRDFQLFAGIVVDGDVGPNTINKMISWTGCEERSVSTLSNSTTTTTLVNTDSTTTTTTPSTTTTTVITVNTDLQNKNYGIVPHVSLTSNEVISLFKGVSTSNDVCGTPYLNSLNPGLFNQYSNGLVSSSLSISNSNITESNITTEITDESSSQIKIKIAGDGSGKYKFYFISPFSSNISNITPDSLSTSLNQTEATFNLDNLPSGVWFYTFAESGNGTVVKASGNREFSVGSISSQQVSSHNGISKFLVTSKNISSGKYENVASGQGFSTSNSLNLVYITDNILDNRLDTSDEIKIDDTIIKLSNENQAFVSEVLLIGTELMKVESKDGNNFTVERGYLNTEIKAYSGGEAVKAIKNLNQESKISNFAYAVFSNETGMRFQVPLGAELTANEFNLNNCNYDRYSLEQITTFSWRSSGSSTVNSISVKDKLNPLFDKAFVVNSGGQSYTPPSLNASDPVSGEFLNDGPRNLVVTEGDIVNFKFDGIVDGSSETRFVRIKFQLQPDTGSTKKSKSREIYIDLDNKNFNFKLNIEKVVSTETNLDNSWEDGYKYIFDSITLLDESTAVEIKNNQTIIYDYKSELGSHNAYYLDQFSFIIKNS
ncbi:MAG: peptidoglycan-binding protein [Flavobacteriaceae bacterium TMED238]|nr:MAG: peptidoglycan-binding protein [Flavobacteriaceae bacterium TMED238]